MIVFIQIATQDTPEQPAYALHASPAPTKSALVVHCARRVSPEHTPQRQPRQLRRLASRVHLVPPRRVKVQPPSPASATSDTPDPTVVSVVHVPSQPTRSTLAMPRAPTARLQRTPQHQQAQLQRPASRVLAIPTRPLRAQPSLLARATSVTRAPTAVSALRAPPVNSKSQQEVQCAPTA
jgi:hypothetical protein